MTVAAFGMPAALAQLGADVAPLPVGPPIGGPLWSYVVPALLLGAAAVGTVMLYRHFAGEKSGGE